MSPLDGAEATGRTVVGTRSAPASRPVDTSPPPRRRPVLATAAFRPLTTRRHSGRPRRDSCRLPTDTSRPRRPALPPERRYLPRRSIWWQRHVGAPHQRAKIPRATWPSLRVTHPGGTAILI